VNGFGEQAFLDAAQATGQYIAVVCEGERRVWGVAEGGVMLHATRGLVARVHTLVGTRSTWLPMLEALRKQFQDRGCRYLYAVAPQSSSDLRAFFETQGMGRIMERQMVRHATVFGPFVPKLDGFVVRPMENHEFPDVRSRLISVISKGPYTPSTREWSAFVETGLLYPYVVSARDDVPIDYAELGLYHHHREWLIGRVERVVVDESWRGKRVSRALVAALIEKSLQLDCTSCELQVRENNTAAIRTYEHLGFVDPTYPEVTYYESL
jgi:GNAT superfamily N-acetyltransferase